MIAIPTEDEAYYGKGTPAQVLAILEAYRNGEDFRNYPGYALLRLAGLLHDMARSGALGEETDAVLDLRQHLTDCCLRRA